MRKSTLLALLITAAAALWVLSGEYGSWVGLSAKEQPAPAGSVAERVERQDVGRGLPSVRVLRSTAEPRLREIVVRGHTKANRQVELKAEVPGQVVELPREKGARVKKGELLARLSADDRLARLAETKAMVRQREIEYEAARKLADKGWRPETQFAANEASLEVARAKLAEMQVELGKTEIRAPFEGVIERRAAELGAYVKAGDPVATIVDGDPLLVVAQVTEQAVGALKVGAPGRARLVTGETVEGRIRFIAAAAEPETRTFRVELEVANPEFALRDGVTAELRLPVREQMAHRLSPAALTLDEAGAVGVRTVDADGVVSFRRVEGAADTPEGIWLTGLPDRVDVIVVGQEFVRAGDRVRAVMTSAE
jgi:membrane fusion protein, multidrug efflux system